MANPTLPPSLQAEFRGLSERISALERGERKVTYMDRLATVDGIVAREMRVRDGERAIYTVGMVNPKYPVMVARFMVQVYGQASMTFRFTATLGNLTTNTRTFTMNGLTDPNRYNVDVFEIAWLHGMPLDEWEDTEAISVLRKCVVRYKVQATKDHVIYTRPADVWDDATAHGFTNEQANVLLTWITPTENTYAVLAFEPEYVFLAPLSTYPTATAEGTLLQGTPAPSTALRARRAVVQDEPAPPDDPPPSDPPQPGRVVLPEPVPPLPVPVFGTPALPEPSPAEPSPFPDQLGAWPLEPRGFGY
ncbi:hypothetical protein [Amycolatopsis sulphurea]|uniref:hypothetical protein n=1 Tax=Amycolatopsis sulphurea TaxID=76022 RepID=UPI001145CA41|nr:hypothetical protein [Amycolatopsis sulphurea]